MSTNKLIDLTYLKDISKGSDEFIKKMLLIFLENAPEAISTLEKDFRNKDWKSLQSTSHKLKAAFTFMGVKELPDIISAIEEHAISERNLDLLPGMILKIKNITEVVMKELELEMERNSLV